MLTIKQPPAFRPLFTTQGLTWVGLSMMQIVFIFYLADARQFSDLHAYRTFSNFISLLLVNCIFGGYISDKYLGRRTSICLGIICQALGYLLITLPQTDTLYAALLCIIIGGSLYFPNTASFLSMFYYNNDGRRFGGFTLLYLAQQLGILFSAVVSGYFLPKFGWTSLFLVAAFAALIALLRFVWGYKHFENRGITSHASGDGIAKLIILCLTWVALNAYLLHHAKASQALTITIGLAVLATLLINIIEEQYEKRNRLLLLTLLFVFTTLFLGLCYQEYMSINLFLERNVMRQFISVNIPSADLLALDAAVTLILGPIASKMWLKLYRKRIMPSPIALVMLSFLLVAIGMGLLSIGTHFPNSAGATALYWVVSALIIVAIGKLIFLPMVLALIPLLAPPKYTSVMIGVWLLSMGIGASAAGWLASIANVDRASITTLSSTNPVYAHAFFIYSMIALLGSGLLYVINLILKKRLPVNIY